MSMSLVACEMMRIQIFWSLYKIPFKKFVICLYSDNKVNCICASSFPFWQNQISATKTPGVPRWVSILQLYCNAHINCSGTLFYCYLGWRRLLKLQSKIQTSWVERRNGLYISTVYWPSNTLDFSNGHCLRLNKSWSTCLPFEDPTRF